MRIRAVVIAVFLVGSAAVSRAPEASAQEGGGWVMLFDGRNFNNWTMTGNANWRISDGIAEADMPRGFLVSRESYGNFELRAEVFTRPESNGGILYRITEPRDPGIQNAYELNINDGRKDQSGRTGSIVNIAAPLTTFDAGNQWVTVELRVVGPKMTARLNGTLTAEATDTKYTRGPVALQAAGGLVRYRNVQIREIK